MQNPVASAASNSDSIENDANADDEFFEQIIRNRLAEANVDSPHSGSALDTFEAALLRFASMPRANSRTDVFNFWRENASQLFPELVDVVVSCPRHSSKR